MRLYYCVKNINKEVSMVFQYDAVSFIEYNLRQFKNSNLKRFKCLAQFTQQVYNLALGQHCSQGQTDWSGVATKRR